MINKYIYINNIYIMKNKLIFNIIFFLVIIIFIHYISFKIYLTSQLSIYNKEYEKNTFINILEYDNSVKSELNNYLIDMKKKENYDHITQTINEEESENGKKSMLLNTKHDYEHAKFNIIGIDLDYYVRKISKMESEIFLNSQNKLSTEVLNYDNFMEIYILINKIYYFITNTQDSFINTIPYLEFIYDKNVKLYRYMNENKFIKIGNIEVVQISNHHHAVEWIYNKFKYDTLPTILHVDTHSDTNSCTNEYPFLKKIKHNKNKISKDSLIHLYDNILKQDIGSVIVPALVPYDENNGVVWLNPDWVKYRNDTFTAKLLRTPYYKNCFLASQEKRHSQKAPLEYMETIKDDKYNINVDYCIGKLNYIYNNINKISNDYILNIDLDYFVSYGSNSSYSDPISYKRTLIDNGMSNKDARYYINKENELQNEIELIRKRIDRFINFINDLKNKGKIPSFIIICNSSKVSSDIFSEPYLDKGLVDMTNEWTPKYLTFWLQNTILQHLRFVLE